MANKLALGIARLKSVAPSALHPFLVTYMFNSKVKFAGTAGIKILQVSPTEVKLRLENKFVPVADWPFHMRLTP
jgi:hypothetical protein